MRSRESLILPAHKVLMLKARSLCLRATGQAEAHWHVEMRRKAVITKRACPWIGEEPNTFVRPVLSSY